MNVPCVRRHGKKWSIKITFCRVGKQKQFSFILPDKYEAVLLLEIYRHLEKVACSERGLFRKNIKVDDRRNIRVV